MASAAALGLGGAVLVPVAAAAAGATVGAVSMIIGKSPTLIRLNLSLIFLE
jgi:hypothetical protein